MKMLTQTGKQRLHDFAIAFATIEYKNELERQRKEPNQLEDSPHNNALVFRYLYENTITMFKNRSDLFEDLKYQ